MTYQSISRRMSERVKSTVSDKAARGGVVSHRPLAGHGTALKLCCVPKRKGNLWEINNVPNLEVIKSVVRTMVGIIH